MMYLRFIRAISAVLPLPKDTRLVSSDGIKEADPAEASKKIQTIIRRYRKKHNLTDDEVQELKRLAIKRFDRHRMAWNKIKNR